MTSGPVDALVDLIERFEDARDTLRAEIAEAHSATKALRQARADLQAAVVEARAEADSRFEAVAQAACRTLQDHIDSEIQKSGTAIHREIRRIADEAWRDRNGIHLLDAIGSWKDLLDSLQRGAGVKDSALPLAVRLPALPKHARKAKP